MKKLIKLLNKYGEEHDIIPVEYNEEDLDSLWRLKKFVRWLVDNDKIDNTWRNASLELYHTSYTMYESLLMLLVISDNPIEVLISYLK